MKISKLQLDSMLLVAIGKLYSAQSAYMINEYKQQNKMYFNNSINAIDTFVKSIESKLTKEEIEFLEDVSDELMNGIISIKKDLDVEPVH